MAGRFLAAIAVGWECRRWTLGGRCGAGVHWPWATPKGPPARRAVFVQLVAGFILSGASPRKVAAPARIVSVCPRAPRTAALAQSDYRYRLEQLEREQRDMQFRM
jgi:hypothetical protein